MFRKTILAASIAMATAISFTNIVSAETIEVKMLNKGADGARNVFEPAFIEAQPGDVIKFVATDKGHNAASIKGMLPEGAEEFKSKISADFELTVTEPGVYGFNCTPHYALGMVGMIYVPGGDVDLEALKAIKQRGKAKDAFEGLFAQLEEKMSM